MRQEILLTLPVRGTMMRHHNVGALADLPRRHHGETDEGDDTFDDIQLSLGLACGYW